MSGNPEQEYFADGMVEEIITALEHAMAEGSQLTKELAISAEPNAVHSGNPRFPKALDANFR